MKEDVIIVDEKIKEKIFFIRGKNVMLDRDLADLYGVQTKVLKQAIRRKNDRFPPDFMFEMNPDEFRKWRSQFVTSKSDSMGLRYAPYCFTEQGVAMLSGVLNSKRAVAVNIQIMRIFTGMREMLLAHQDILLKLEYLERKILLNEHHVKKQEEEIILIFRTLKQLLNPPQTPRKKIGYRFEEEKENI